MDVEQQRAAGVGRVGTVLAPACQAPQQKAVNGAKGKLTELCAFTNAIDMLREDRFNV